MRKKNLYTVIGIVAALVIGFLIGISVNYPNANNNELAGTIGKANKYRNVTVTEEDIQLRSDLSGDTVLQKAYIDFFCFHYAMAAEITDALEMAIEASEKLSDFKNINAPIIDKLTKYSVSINQMRGDLLLAITTFMNIENVDAATISWVLNNAGIAISKLSYNDDALIAFIDESANFLKGKTNSDALLLRKAHDKLMLLQVAKAVVLKDKPKMKYLDGKEMFAGQEKLFAASQEKISLIVHSDQAYLQFYNNNEQLGVNIFNQEQLGQMLKSDDFQSSINFLGGNFFNMENLGITSNENLGAIMNVENLSKCLINNIENLSSNLYNTETFGTGFIQ